MLQLLYTAFLVLPFTVGGRAYTPCDRCHYGLVSYYGCLPFTRQFTRNYIFSSSKSVHVINTMSLIEKNLFRILHFDCYVLSIMIYSYYTFMK